MNSAWNPKNTQAGAYSTEFCLGAACIMSASSMARLGYIATGQSNLSSAANSDLKRSDA